MIINNDISLQQPFIKTHKIETKDAINKERANAAEMFVSYLFEKSLNQVLDNNRTTATGDQLSSGSLLARQQMNAQVAQIIARSSGVTKAVANQLK